MYGIAIAYTFVTMNEIYNIWKWVTIVAVGVFEMLGCTHCALKCSVLYLQQVLVSGFFGYSKSLRQ